jgi:hypothetical protein
MGRICGTISVLFVFAALLASCATVPGREAVRPSLPSSGEYLARGMAEFDAADSLRQKRSPMPVMGGVFGWPPDHEKWLRHLEQAEDDFRAILDRFPTSPEAPEAQFMLGRINDHPQRNVFDNAVAEYRRTVERYPATPAAEKARKRIELIESIK